MSIEIKNINKKFGEFVALKDVNLEIKPGELVALLGPSGSGKTTLLRVIAGLEFPDFGEVVIEGEKQEKDVKERNVGFVFQHYALFKHMTVFENVAFGLKVRKKNVRPSDDEIKDKVMKLLSLVHLAAFHDRYPSQLSGGQRQRVALARALAVEPNVLLLDEPFGALDAKVRKELRRWMRRLHDDIHITSVFVTHDQEEAMEVADRIVVMNQGRIEQVGTPEQIWNNPANAFIYDFIGNFNEFEGVKDARGNIHLTEYDSRPVKVAVAEHEETGGVFKSLINKMLSIAEPLNITEPRESYSPIDKVKGEQIKIYARPHEIEVVRVPQENEYISGKVVHINPAGSTVKIELERKNGKIIQADLSVEIFRELKLQKGSEAFVRPKVYKVF